MSSSYPGPIDRLHRPEYTGENRCMPCTIFNSVLAVLLAAAVGGIGAAYVSPQVGLVAGTAVLLVSALAIGLRGYLVPKTPYITKTYFPEWVLAYFEKEPPTVRDETGLDAAAATDEESETVEDNTDEHWADVEADGEFVEDLLQDAGALEECDDVDDLCLTPAFRDAWRDRIVDLREEDHRAREQLADILDADPDELEFEEHGEAVVAKKGPRRVGKWESRAALVADMAAARTLEERYEPWAGLHMRQRSAALNGVRVFLEHCPECDGIVSVGEERVESCCREYDIMAVSCEDCGARLFEAGHEQPPSPPK